ncbi:MAG: 2-haloacid dehalogenase [Ilumatobacteraceae bacterium]|jgi:putative hydrolase of the HAD superfamily
MDLTKYAALSFDCYGTLIDWEAGILGVLGAWTTELGLDIADDRLLATYAEHESATEREHPLWLYPAILAEAFGRTGRSLGVGVDETWAGRLGDSVADWPAFSDSSAALAALAEHYRLIIVSNVHRAGFAASNIRLQADFAAIITAEDVGAYKPADNHFVALDRTLVELGIERTQLLHVAQSLFHDHVPARRRGLTSIWINRRNDRSGWGATPEPSDEYSYALEFASMGEFAAAANAAFSADPHLDGGGSHA